MAAEPGAGPPASPGAGSPVRVWVATVAHRGDDARITHRQIRTLRAEGMAVTLVAPLPPAPSLGTDPAGLVRVAVPRARGRRRLGSHRAALRALRGGLRRGEVDLVILHDPELLIWVPVLGRRVPVVWDVHEDYLASVADRRYVPARLRPVLRTVVRGLERLALRRCHVILAEESYRARLGDHPVVPNATWVPDTLPDTMPEDHPEAEGQAGGLPRVVYIGRLARARGVDEMIEIARRLTGVVRVELIGEPDADVADLVATAVRDGLIDHTSYLPNPEAVARLEGALAGLSLLADLENYRHSQPTKLIEYLAHGVPVISTPLPVATGFVTASGGGMVVSWEQVVEDTVAVLRSWAADPAAARALGAVGHAHVRAEHSWQTAGAEFAALIRTWAQV